MVCFGDEGGTDTSNRLCVEIGIFNYSSTRNGLYIVNASGAGFSCVNMNSLTTNTWYHVVYVNNNGTGQLYLNNVQQSTATGGLNIGPVSLPVNPNLNALPDNVMVGARDDGYKSVSGAGIDAGLSGAIDEIRLFNIVGTFNIADTDTFPEPGTLALFDHWLGWSAGLCLAEAEIGTRMLGGTAKRCGPAGRLPRRRFLSAIQRVNYRFYPAPECFWSAGTFFNVFFP